MKLFLIRFVKSTFIYLQLHRFFGFFTGAISNLLYLTKFSAWAYANRKIAFNDFVSKWDYTKRYAMYEWVIENYQLNVSVNYLEFGVASGHSFADILAAYPYLEEEDLREALAYAAWRVEEIEVPLVAA